MRRQFGDSLECADENGRGAFTNGAFNFRIKSSHRLSLLDYCTKTTYRLIDQSRSRCFQRRFVVSLMGKLNSNSICLFHEAGIQIYFYNFSCNQSARRSPAVRLQTAVGKSGRSKDFLQNSHFFLNLENDVGEDRKHRTRAFEYVSSEFATTRSGYDCCECLIGLTKISFNYLSEYYQKLCY